MEQRVAGAIVMVLQVALVAVVVAMVSFWQAPPYKAPEYIPMTKQTGEEPTYKAWTGIWILNNPNGKIPGLEGRYDGLTEPDGVGWGTSPPVFPKRLRR